MKSNVLCYCCLQVLENRTISVLDPVYCINFLSHYFLPVAKLSQKTGIWMFLFPLKNLFLFSLTFSYVRGMQVWIRKRWTGHFHQEPYSFIHSISFNTELCLPPKKYVFIMLCFRNKKWMKPDICHQEFHRQHIHKQTITLKCIKCWWSLWAHRVNLVIPPWFIAMKETLRADLNLPGYWRSNLSILQVKDWEQPNSPTSSQHPGKMKELEQIQPTCTYKNEIKKILLL